jgi:hypothetical protein
LVKGTDEPGAIHEFRLERSFTERANNEDWLENNFDKTVHPMANERGDHPTLAEEEERILRCLGAAVIMQWNTLPTKLQKELFDNASSMGDLLQTDALKGQIARFLHKHKDDGAGPSSDASRKGGR